MAFGQTLKFLTLFFCLCRQSPLMYLLTDVGVRLAASASSFWLIPRSFSKAASLFPVNVAILYPFSVVCGENRRSGVEYKKYQRSPSLDGQSSESGRRRVLTTEKTGCHRSFFISRGHPTSAYAPSTSRKRTRRNGRCWPSRPGHEELH